MNDGHKNSFVNLLGLQGAKEQKRHLLEELEGMLSVMDLRVKARLQSIVDAYFKR